MGDGGGGRLPPTDQPTRVQPINEMYFQDNFQDNSDNALLYSFLVNKLLYRTHLTI